MSAPWETRAACAGADAAEFFEHAHYGGPRAPWIRICAACPVSDDCLRAAMEAEAGAGWRYGIFGGLTPDQRWRLAESTFQSTGLSPSRSTTRSITMDDDYQTIRPWREGAA